MNLKRARELESQGLINIQKHNDYNLWILKYTKKVTYGNLWTKELKMCRGLVINEDNIIARPFDKFFNYEEPNCYSPNKEELFSIYEKMDGSLGICFYYDNKWIITTSGSFHSIQAATGNNILNLKYGHLLEELSPKFTYMFEIIAPQHRIVVDYGEKEDLVYLSHRGIKTGRYFNYLEGFPNCKKYNYKDWTKIQSLNTPNSEGFVIQFESGNRIKIKFEEYMRLHAIVTRCTSYDIWEHLKNGESVEHLKDRVPDEFKEFLESQVSTIKANYSTLKETSINNYRKILDEVFNKRGNRKMFVKIASNYPDNHRILCLLDAKSIEDSLWKECKPKFQKAFNNISNE